MSALVIEAEVPQELATVDLLAQDSVSTSAAAPVPMPARPRPAPTMAAARAAESSVIERMQVLGNLALAEASYQMRRLGAATVVGVAAVVAAATILLASDLPQSAVVAALKSQLVRLTPLGKSSTVAAPTGAMLAALPLRAEAPNVVAKILEEAHAAGVDLPRGQYEYVPARDGVAARYRMTFPVRATYPRIRAFMDRTLVALPAVAVEGLRIERKTVGDESVDAELKFAAYVRSDP